MIWTTKDGVEIPIAEMTTAHIENCMKLMERSGNTQSMYCAFDENGKPWADRDVDPVYVALVEEMEARKK
jgi:hypothetical protein